MGATCSKQNNLNNHKIQRKLSLKQNTDITFEVILENFRGKNFFKADKQKFQTDISFEQNPRVSQQVDQYKKIYCKGYTKRIKLKGSTYSIFKKKVIKTKNDKQLGENISIDFLQMCVSPIHNDFKVKGVKDSPRIYFDALISQMINLQISFKELLCEFNHNLKDLDYYFNFYLLKQEQKIKSSMSEKESTTYVKLQNSMSQSKLSPSNSLINSKSHQKKKDSTVIFSIIAQEKIQPLKSKREFFDNQNLEKKFQLIRKISEEGKNQEQHKIHWNSIDLKIQVFQKDYIKSLRIKRYQHINLCLQKKIKQQNIKIKININW